MLHFEVRSVGLKQGGRVRDHLRDGVGKAIVQIGNGFLQHPKNQKLRDALTPPSPSLGEGEKPSPPAPLPRGERGDRKISDRDFYRQLLLLIYRLLFLMVAIRNLSLYAPTDKAQLRRVNYAALDRDP